MSAIQTPGLKICGITKLEDARYVAGAFADFLGFIFYNGSPRFINPKHAAEIIGWVHGPKCVGVFVNQQAEEINTVIEHTGIELVQLHGDETPDIAEKIRCPIIKSFRINSIRDIPQIKYNMMEWTNAADFFLFDTKTDKQHGGSGTSWDWNLLDELNPQKAFFLAGGISVHNVVEAVTKARPYAIDLSSSIEQSPGIKDFDKLQVFFDRWNDLIRKTDL